MIKNVFIILNSLLYEILSFLSQAKGIVLNPVSTKYYTYCIGKDEPIILTNPFPDILHGAGLDHLVGMEWYRNVSGNQVKLTSALEPFQSPVPKIVSYEKWGLQINSVSPKDSGVYLAIMSSTTYTTRQTAVNIFVASYPVLKSESLSVKETTNGGGSKTYSCGQIAFLGQPPINIIMKGSDGTVLPSTYRDGYQLVTLPYSKDGQQVTCEVDKNSTAYHCIPEADLSRWGLPTIKEPHTAKSDSNIPIRLVNGNGPNPQDVLFISKSDFSVKIVDKYVSRLTVTPSLAERKVYVDLKGVSSADAGMYTCYNGISYNNVNANCGQKLVIVRKPNKPTIQELTSALEGDNLKLACMTNSTSLPTDHGLKSVILWRNEQNQIIGAPGTDK
ncbi:hypothetical protein Btru_064600, partial [Bulinus truncatus]